MATKPKIAFIDTGWSQGAYRKRTGHYGAIAYYRLAKPMQYLTKWFDIDFWGKRLEQFGDTAEAYPYLAENYDLILSKHLDNGNAASQLLAMADHFKTPVIVDLDDDYLNIRESNAAAKDYSPLKGGRYWLGAFISLSNGLFVSTEPLKQTYSDYLKQFPSSPELISVLPNCNDVNDWRFKRVRKKDGKIRIGYMGSITHDDDLELIYEPIGKILDRHKNVMFEICGAIPPEKIEKVIEKIQKHAARDVTSQIWFYGGTQAWYGFPKHMFSLGWDIGLAPLIDDQFNRGKSHIKWFDYTMVGIPTVASPVYPYFQLIQGIQTIQNGVTGYLANTTQQWVEYIEILLASEKLREEIAGKAFKYIKDNWQYSQHISKWKEALEKYL